MKTDNQIIAEFMSDGILKPHPDKLLFPNDFGYECWPDKDRKWRNVNFLHYQTSWDWLMPVVEKISKIDGINFNLSSFDGAAIYDDNYKFTATGKRFAENMLSIESVYEVVVNFIRWYNSQSLYKQ